MFKSVYDYEGPYAMIVARQLPNVPVGVNPKNPAVINIINQILPFAGPVLAVDTLRKAQSELDALQQPFKRVRLLLGPHSLVRVLLTWLCGCVCGCVCVAVPGVCRCRLSCAPIGCAGG